MNPDDRILLYTPFDHNVVSNGRVELFVFLLVDSIGSGAVEPYIYLLLLLHELSYNNYSKMYDVKVLFDIPKHSQHVHAIFIICAL